MVCKDKKSSAFLIDTLGFPNSLLVAQRDRVSLTMKINMEKLDLFSLSLPYTALKIRRPALDQRNAKGVNLSIVPVHGKIKEKASLHVL